MLAYLKTSFIISWYVKIIAELSALIAISMFRENPPSGPPTSIYWQEPCFAMGAPNTGRRGKISES